MDWLGPVRPDYINGPPIYIWSQILEPDPCGPWANPPRPVYLFIYFYFFLIHYFLCISYSPIFFC